MNLFQGSGAIHFYLVFLSFLGTEAVLKISFLFLVGYKSQTHFVKQTRKKLKSSQSKQQEPFVSVQAALPVLLCFGWRAVNEDNDNENRATEL